MKTQNLNNKLNFNKSVIVELNDDQLTDVNGGSSPVCTAYFVTGVIVGILIK